MVFIFKSETPGIKTEQWQLNTHPVLLQGASIQVTLRGVSLYQDKTADQRLFLEVPYLLNCVSAVNAFAQTDTHMCFCLCFLCVQTKLEKIVAVKQCRSIVYEMLRGVHSPERPSSPAELYITEEQEFLSKNPKVILTDSATLLVISDVVVLLCANPPWSLYKIWIYPVLSTKHDNAQFVIFYFTCSLRHVANHASGWPGFMSRRCFRHLSWFNLYHLGQCEMTQEGVVPLWQFSDCGQGHNQPIMAAPSQPAFNDFCSVLFHSFCSPQLYYCHRNSWQLINLW